MRTFSARRSRAAAVPSTKANTVARRPTDPDSAAKHSDDAEPAVTVHNVLAVLATFAFVLGLGTTALFVVNRWERHHQRQSRRPDVGFRVGR
jgi:hypothetical protein